MILGISCALMALSLQRWARPPTSPTIWAAEALITSSSTHHSPVDQARLRTLFTTRMETSGLSFLVEALHALVHLAFSIFLAGFLLYLYDLNADVFEFASVAVALSSVGYVVLTLLPIIQPGSPYSTPFSKVIAAAYASVLILFRKTHFHVSRTMTAQRDVPLDVPPLPSWKNHFREWYLSSMKLKRAQNLGRKLDIQVLSRTFDLLRSDDDLEHFFDAIPGFCLSNPREDTR
jgi:hypothetical protein